MRFIPAGEGCKEERTASITRIRGLLADLPRPCRSWQADLESQTQRSLFADVITKMHRTGQTGGR